ncbi:hypothetical protein AArcSl_1646 [Halalkaliarchaeum desulfuricum]|uniref:Uncharacterized protein n=1 Tax=Halalkaliarchaeum desulfuricum TaxID=2055893 RepID=A0A343TJK3_9EURY|nr:hypothetical protein [Halalkaliarchaeum desulfuricum]AUX09275.1 hypothetical protein AArcSl_1646 [Halalkaliarchaeum desulfuricum]
MARKEASKRLLLGIVYLPVYYFILYPVVFFLGVLVTAVDILWTIVFGESLGLVPAWSSSTWESISQPVTWIFGGSRSDKPSWMF